MNKFHKIKSCQYFYYKSYYIFNTTIYPTTTIYPNLLYIQLSNLYVRRYQVPISMDQGKGRPPSM